MRLLQRDQAGARVVRPRSQPATSAARRASAIRSLPWQAARRYVGGVSSYCGGQNATCKDHEWLLDALISEVSIWGCEERGQGSRTLPTANSEFLRSLVPLNGDAKNGARVIRLFRVANNHNLAGRYLPAPD